jgi:hypothetical protein
MKRKHTLRLTSDDVVSECVLWLTPDALALVVEIAQTVNAQAKFSVDIRMEVDPTDSTTHQGDAA